MNSHRRSSDHPFNETTEGQKSSYPILKNMRLHLTLNLSANRCSNLITSAQNTIVNRVEYCYERVDTEVSPYCPIVNKVMLTEPRVCVGTDHETIRQT